MDAQNNLLYDKILIHVKYQNVPTFPNNNEKFHSNTAYTSVTSEIAQRSIIPINHSFIH